MATTSKSIHRHRDLEFVSVAVHVHRRVESVSPKAKVPGKRPRYRKIGQWCPYCGFKGNNDAIQLTKAAHGLL